MSKYGTAYVYTVHEIKISPLDFEHVFTNDRAFHLLTNGLDFHIGDKLVLREWKNGEYTGRECERWVQYISHGTGLFGLSPGYCVLGISENIEDVYKPT